MMIEENNMKRNNKLWMLGDVLDTIPGKANYVDGLSYCSLETAAEYMGCGGVFWYNTSHDMSLIDEAHVKRLAGIENICCILTHIEENGPGKGGWKLYYKEAAEKVSRLSLNHPEIKGALIDDFMSETGPSRYITPEYMEEVYAALKSANPNLKLYVVQYLGRQTPKNLLPFKDCIDGLSVWNWIHTTHYWEAEYERDIWFLRDMFPGKLINQGQFIHDFGGKRGAMPMDFLKLQCDKILEQYDAGMLDEWCLIQSGFLSKPDHREQFEYLRNLWYWLTNSRTVLK
ncbi:MAG: hypothetical protein IKS20_12540 [Victivallales bacterium]|nr:hypothetical protein [Victivallales bacterium]